MKLEGHFTDRGIMYSQETLEVLLLLSDIHLSSLEHKRLELTVAKLFQCQVGKLDTL
jgi:hypothetical protein